MFKTLRLGNPGGLWIGLSALHLLGAGLVPLVELVIEHRSRAGVFLSTHPHYFFFQLFVCPLAVFRLGTPLRYLWENVLTKVGRAAFIGLPLLISALGCIYDFRVGAPSLVEFVHSVQDDHRY